MFFRQLQLTSDKSNDEKKDESDGSPTKKTRKEEEASNDTMCGTAFRLWGSAGIVPAVHLLGNSDAPGLEIYEFIEGRGASWELAKHGAEFMHNAQDAKSFGKLVGRMHSQPHDWYEPFKDTVKPQWETWQVGMKTNQEARQMREKYGDYASMVVLFCDNFAKLGTNTATNCKAVKELNPLLHGFLDPKSLLGKLVVGHGDLHGGNIMHRTKGTDSHGDLVAIDLDFVGRYPAAIDLGTALGSTMSGPYGSFFNKGEPIGEYPSLEIRRRFLSFICLTFSLILFLMFNFSNAGDDNVRPELRLLRGPWCQPYC